jgi:ferrochelatase
MSRTGVLLINLGSPDSPAVPDVRRYLREFLMDERVIDIPFIARWLLVHGIILPFRPRKSAEAYRKIWTEEGSPLVNMSRRVQAELQKRLPIPVELAMRYQNPSVDYAIGRLMLRGVNRVVLVPMFPHYAMSSYETAVESVRENLPASVELIVVPPYFDQPEFMDALIVTARPYLSRQHDHLLFSFHGVPERQIRKTDPTHSHCLAVQNCCDVPNSCHDTCYRTQCLRTARTFAVKVGIPQYRYTVAFQSRLGRDEWLKPATDQEIVRLAKSGVKRLVVMCPAFVSDCLETIEEIGMRGREAFLAAGGESFELVPCLNDHPKWIDGLESLIKRNTSTRVLYEIASQRAV